jgi:glycosyltransferase involved in cell wall biosynthesis
MVSVIIPARNAERTIGPCVDSLLALQYPAQRLELRVVDNGSTDGTAARLAAYREQLAIVREPRPGAAAARNAGLRGAAGEIVAFTDADCVVDPGWLAALVRPLRDPAVGIVGGTILALAPANPVERFGETIHDHRMAIEEYDPPYVITMSWASRVGVLRELGGFDERFRRCQDVELSYRALQAGYRFAFAPAAIVHHRNERDLRGLIGEGFTHGFHGVRVHKRHADFLHERGHSDVSPAAWRRLAAGIVDCARGRADVPLRCQTAFDAGKRIGKVLGSIRFGQLDL